MNELRQLILDLKNWFNCAIKDKIARKGVNLPPAGESIAKLEDAEVGIMDRYFRYLGGMSLLKTMRKVIREENQGGLEKEKKSFAEILRAPKVNIPKVKVAAKVNRMSY